MVENSYFLVYLFVTFFEIIIIGMIIIKIQSRGTALLHACRIKAVSPHIPIISIIIWKEYTLLLAMFNLLYSSKNLKKNFCHQSSHFVKITDSFHYEWEPSHAYQEIDTFRGEQRWMGHKGGGHW